MTRETLSSASGCTHRSSLTIAVALFAVSLSTALASAQIRTMIVDSTGDVGQYSSLALDSQHRAHIAYYDVTSRVLKYARILDSGRTVEVADGTSGVGSYCAIAVDGTGAPHISYYDAMNKDLKYAVKHGSTWTVRTVDGPGNVGKFTSIAVDQLNNPYISYYDEGNGSLKLAYVEGGAWEIKRCCDVSLNDSISDTGRATAIRLEHMASRPLILFFDFASQSLKLAVFDRTLNQWGVEHVRDAGVALQDLSFSLSAGNEPRIAYSEVSDTGAESVQYAKKTCLAAGCLTQVTPTQPTGEGNWSFEQLDAAAGDSVSLALAGTQELPWVSYYDLAYGLRLAQRSGTGWSLQTIDPGWQVGLWSSLAVHDGSEPHISYHDQTNGDLKYASTSLPQAIDVWIKDCANDDGSVPSTPNCAKWRASPDIWFDTNGDGRPDPPAPGVMSKLNANVRNRGYGTAQHTTVSFYFFKVPARFDPSGPRLPVRPENALIGQDVVTVPYHHSPTASLSWRPPKGVREWCIGVILDHPADRPIRPLALPPNDNNTAVHCYPPVDP